MAQVCVIQQSSLYTNGLVSTVPQHYIRFKTMVEITKTPRHANLYVLLRVLCRAEELSAIRLRYVVSPHPRVLCPSSTCWQARGEENAQRHQQHQGR